jgi:replicative DNA helicase
MKRRKVAVDKEKDILLGMIISDRFLRDIRTVLDIGLFRNPYSKRVARWCLDYYSGYEESPKGEIQSIFDGEKENISEEETEYIEKFLVSMSKKVEKMESYNDKFHLDNAEFYLKERKLSSFVASVKADLEEGDIAKAENRVVTFERLERPRGEGVDVLEDIQKVANAISEMNETLLRVNGDLGKLVGDFHRGDLVALAGPPKRGKSWWLQFFAIAALTDGLSVLFVSLEMLENQCIKRLVQSFTGCSIKEREVDVPKFRDMEDGGCRVVYETKKLESLSIEGWEQAVKNFKRHNPSSRFRLLTYPQDTFSNEDLEIHLENLEYYEDFIPDVVIVDYEDIMAPEPDSPRDYRQRLDHSWKKARSLAQKRNLLYFTATQTDRSTLRRDAYADNVAEDMRKLAHVAKMIGLNQDKDEKGKGLMRLALWLERHDGSLETDEVVVTQCLSIGKPCMDSRWKKKVKGVYDASSKKKGAK